MRRAELELVDQRVRIARELHDVVAHGMSVITVQAGFAGLVADDPDEVRSALGSIETTGRQTLSEMRTLLEVLRDGAELDEPTLSPAPRMDDLDALIDRIREAGVDVVLTRRGPTTALSPLIELNAYRIVQEALTNVVKHAGPVRATVHLEYDDSRADHHDPRRRATEPGRLGRARPRHHRNARAGQDPGWNPAGRPACPAAATRSSASFPSQTDSATPRLLTADPA